MYKRKIQAILIALLLAVETIAVPMSAYGAQSVSENAVVEVEIVETDGDVEEIAEPVSDDVSAEKATIVNSYGKKQTLNGVTISYGGPVWDCIYFGSYWQEDTNNDGIADSFDKKTKIKWRVLSVNGTEALLISDKVLDAFWYKNDLMDSSYSIYAVTWMNAAIRKKCLSDFEDNAFSSAEKASIYLTNNEGALDNVYIPTSSMMTNSAYGFSTSTYKAAKNTAYAAHRQYYFNGNTSAQSNVNTTYWLQDVTSSSSSSARAITSAGIFGDYNKSTSFLGIRPVVRIDISDTDIWQYAGTVSGDGTISEKMEICSITENVTNNTPVTTLVAGENYYFRMVMDMEMASGAKIILNVTTPAGKSEQYISSNSGYEDMYSTIYAPMSFTEIGEYTYDLTVKLADGSEVVSSSIARKFTVYNSTQKSGKINDNVRWQYNTSSKTLTLTGSGGVSALKGKTEISVHVNDIQNLKMSEGITSISLGDFKDAVFLNKVICPTSLEQIGSEAFRRSAVKEVSFSKGLQVVNEFSFQGCRNLRNIVIPETVLEIHSNAFADCENLTSVTLKGAQKLFTSAFKGTSINSIVLPSNLDSICVEEIASVWDTYSYSPFDGCEYLNTIEVDKNNKKYVSKDGVLFTKDEKTLVLCPPAKTGTYTIPNTVQSLGWCAFYGCDKLTKINLNDSMKELNLHAFSGTQIRDMVIPKSVKTITYDGGYRSNDYALYNFFDTDTQIDGFTISPGTSIDIDKMESNPSYAIPDLSHIKVYGFSNTDAQRFSEDWGLTLVSQGTCYDLTFDVLDKVIKISNGKRYDAYFDLPIPEKDGYYFDGWYTEPSGGVKIEGATIVNVTENQKLYARWGKKVDLSVVNIANVACQTYTGKSITPLPTIIYNGKTLKKDVDYTLSYANNINPGTATITITGKGKYTGTKKVTFEIKVELAKATIDTLDYTYQKGNLSKLNSKNHFSLYLDFTPVDYALKYEIELTNNKGKKVKSVIVDCANKDYVDKTIKNLTGAVYGVRIRAIRDDVYGDWSTKAFVLKQPRAQARSYNGNVQIKWEKINGATGYEIYMCDKRNGKYKKVATAGKNVTLKTVKKYNKKKLGAKTYYYYVVAKKKADGKTYKSSKNFVYKVVNKS